MRSAAHTRWWQTFEAVFGLPFVAALVLQWAVPFALPRALTPGRVPVGVALIIMGIALVVLARRTFAQQRQPTDPGQPTTALVTSGVFSVSRNPLYLGGLCVLVGVALALDLPWVLVLLVPSVIAGQRLLIVPEERYLAATFGKDYAGYAATVRRWLGRARRSQDQ